MNLAEIAAVMDEGRCLYKPETMVRRIIVDSRQAGPGDLFVALPGSKTNGHQFVRDVIDAGAAVAVCEDSFVPEGASAIYVPDTRSFCSLAAHALAGDPTASILLVGITGTNGKTSVTYLIESILSKAGFKVGVIGTISARVGEFELARDLTTPDGPTLVGLFMQMKQMGCNAVVMEISSHGLHQRRVDGCRFDVAVFTNLSRDHLDYHGDEKSYAEAKQLLFSQVLPRWGKKEACACSNIDDPKGEWMISRFKGRKLRFSCKSLSADIRLENVRFSRQGLRCDLMLGDSCYRVFSPLLGRFQSCNIAAASSAVYALGILPEHIVSGIAECLRVPGRLDKISEKPLVLVDYAHTPDAVTNALASVSELATSRIITLIGCGGDRDKGKRPLMGEKAALASTITVITSDNPRTENPTEIIEQILPGVRKAAKVQINMEQIADYRDSGHAYVVEPDRRKAIWGALLASDPEDVILIAGKGHEDYQIIGTTKHHFDDREEAIKALAELHHRKGS